MNNAASMKNLHSSDPAGEVPCLGWEGRRSVSSPIIPIMGPVPWMRIAVKRSPAFWRYMILTIFRFALRPT